MSRVAEPPMDPLLRVHRLSTEFRTPSGTIRAVQEVSWSVSSGETLGVVGESGSGKTVAMMSILGLLPPNGHVVAGSVSFRGSELIGVSERQVQQVRGKGIAVVFQDPMTALNPVMTVAQQIDESLRRHSTELGRKARRVRIIELLDQVRIPNAARRADQYPHEFSGGMRQRAMIAMAIANRPLVILADEPTTALDVTVQAQILSLLRDLQDEIGAALVLVTHDLGVIAEVADRAVVMYGGRVVESGTVTELFDSSRHPYTQGLLASRPVLHRGTGSRRVTDRGALPAIAGQPPSPMQMPAGCAFRPRCDLSAGRDACLTNPDVVTLGSGRTTACHFHQELDSPPEQIGKGRTRD